MPPKGLRSLVKAFRPVLGRRKISCGLSRETAESCHEMCLKDWPVMMDIVTGLFNYLHPGFGDLSEYGANEIIRKEFL